MAGAGSKVSILSLWNPISQISQEDVGYELGWLPQLSGGLWQKMPIASSRTSRPCPWQFNGDELPDGASQKKRMIGIRGPLSVALRIRQPRQVSFFSFPRSLVHHRPRSDLLHRLLLLL